MARGVGGRVEHFGQELLAGGVAMQHAVLAAFLVVQHELHGHAGVAGPVRVGRRAAVADQVAGVGGGGVVGHRRGDTAGQGHGQVVGRQVAVEGQACFHVLQVFLHQLHGQRLVLGGQCRDDGIVLFVRVLGGAGALVHQRDQGAARHQLAQHLGQHVVAHELGHAHVEVAQQLGALAHVVALHGLLLGGHMGLEAR